MNPMVNYKEQSVVALPTAPPQADRLPTADHRLETAPPQADSSPTRTAALNLFSAQAHAVLTMLLGLAATPLLLGWLGPERFGLLRVLTTFTEYVGIVSSCLLLAGGIALVPRLARGEVSSCNRLLGTAGACLAVLAFLGVGGGLCLSFLLPSIAPAPLNLGEERWQAFAIGLLPLGLTPFLLARAVFEADQRSYRVNLALIGHALFLTSFSLWAARAGWGLPGMTLATLLATCVQVGLLLFWARRDFPWIAPARPAGTELRALGKATAALLSVHALGVFAASIEPLAVNYYCGPAQLAAYLLSQRLFSLGVAQAAFISQAVWARFSNLYHQSRSDLIALRVRDCLQAICAFSYSAGLTLFAYDRHFIRLWVGDQLYGGDALVLPFALSLPVLGMQAFHGWLLTGTGHARKSLPGVAIYALCMLSSCFLLGRHWGPVGVAWGVLGASAVLLWRNLSTIHRILNVPWRSLIEPYAKATVLAVPLGAVTWRLAQSHTPWGWLGLAAEATLAAAVYLSLWWRLALTATDRGGWKTRLNTILGWNTTNQPQSARRTQRRIEPH